jgi:glycosyltransferase involved in cell wall biosynthesis
MEAMANKCTVISTNQTGCEEMVADVGLCLPANEPQQLNSALKNLIENPDQIKEMGEKSMEKIRSYYSSSVVSKSYLDLLQRIVDNG